jgi:hypothetical protein
LEEYLLPFLNLQCLSNDESPRTYPFIDKYDVAEAFIDDSVSSKARAVSTLELLLPFLTDHKPRIPLDSNRLAMPVVEFILD